ncbi:hypothetical protein [Alkalilimnicola sp. S0819]|uniref:baeRF3 domain-containing protein n=1 Tax=Alkalilimnicola sp. S0819 TaxID=2613922 RepID=UPI001D02407D|nr:hypothetical protein [Alkalilimnicola sp. S0819]
MSNPLAEDFAKGIFRTPRPPCLSLCQSTHRSHPDDSQDRIRFGNLVKTLEELLAQKYPRQDSAPLLQPFHDLAADRDFWIHTGDGLAVLAAPGLFRAYPLERPVEELALVGERFHIKPLLRMLQSADDYQILGISRQEARLYQGNRDGLHQVELPADFPRTLADVIPEHDNKPQPIRTHGSAEIGGVHGAASLADLEKGQIERFFRSVDRAMFAQYSRPRRLPLVLLALPENQGDFRRLSHNPFLLEQGIDASPTALSVEDLRRRAWEVIEPQYLQRLAALCEMFAAARARAQGDADLVLIGRNAVAGRIATLLIEADRQVPGHIDGQSGAVEFDEPGKAATDDLLDDLGELVLSQGGRWWSSPPSACLPPRVPPPSTASSRRAAVAGRR